jgi:hypothetical protein
MELSVSATNNNASHKEALRGNVFNEIYYLAIDKRSVRMPLSVFTLT